MAVTLLNNYLTLPWEQARGYLVQDLINMQSAMNTLTQVNELDTLGNGWTDVAFNSAYFSCNALGSITPNQVNPYAMLFRVITSTMWLNTTFTLTVNNAFTSEIRVKIPPGYPLRTLGSVGADIDNRQRTTGLWNSAGASGVTLVSVNVTGGYLSIERWDGVPVALFPNATQCVFSVMITIPLA